MKRISLLLLSVACLVVNAFGQGAFVEYKITADKNNMTGDAKTYYLNGNTKSEIQMMLPGMPAGGGTDVISLSRKDVPDSIFIINEKSKTYSSMSVKDKNSNSDEGYEITVLGKEKIGNYNTTHVKVVYKKTKKETEMWTSKDVSDYAFFKNIKNKYLDGGKLYEALDANGAGGFPVRMVVAETKWRIQLDLVKAEKQSMDASIFNLDGYTRTAAISPMQDMREKIKNMTPEEKQQFIEQMKAQHQQGSQNQ
jgi:hypothetical protein